MKKYIILTCSIVILATILLCLHFLNLVIFQQGTLIKDIDENIKLIINNEVSIQKEVEMEKDKYYLFSYIDKNAETEKIGLAVYRKFQFSPFYQNIRMEYNKESYGIDAFTEGNKGDTYTYLTLYGVDRSNKFSNYEILTKYNTIKENIQNTGVFIKVHKLKNEIILDINMYDVNGKKI